jgi:outer membrane lipoprotein-sorting protein
VNESNKTAILREIAEQAVPDTLDLWPAIHTQVDPATAPRSAGSGPASTRRAWRRRSFFGLAAAAALALVVGAGSLVWNQPQAASAQAILDRAQATANDASLVVTTYHLVLTRQVPGKGNAQLATEIWYGGKDRQRSETRTVDGTGATSTQGTILNGAQTWLYFTTEEGKLQVVHTVGTTWNSPVEDPSKQASLADVLAQYSNAKGCMQAQQHGEATVANRPTYVIVATPKPGGCGGPLDAIAQAKARAASQVRSGPSAGQDNQIGQMTVWVDEQTFLPLRTEVRSMSGTVLDRSEVTSVEYNVAIPDATFAYTPPAGANVFNYSGGSGADVKKALAERGAMPSPKATSAAKP